MVENELAMALRDFIRETVGEYRLPVKNGEMRAPTVVNGFLPPKRSNAEDDFPFVLVRLEKGQTTLEETTCTAVIIIGCYTTEFDGHEYCINVMERIKQALCSLPFGTLAERYQLRYPVKWELPDEQPYPQWQVGMTTEWAMQAPVVEFGGESDD
jgi:hypothetical protein